MLGRIMDKVLSNKKGKKNGVMFKKYNKKKRKYESARSTFMPTTIRPIAIDDITRRFISIELYDTFKGLGLSYVLAKIQDTFANDQVAKDMKDLALSLPILKNLINELSKVYNQQPIRKFFTVDGKQIVKKIPEYGDKALYLESEKLSNIFQDAFYNQKNHTTFKFFEKMVNLLKTVVVKATWNAGEKKIELVYVPNDLIEVQLDRDLKAEEFIFSTKRMDYIDNTIVDQTYEQVESWTLDEFFPYASDKEPIENTTPKETKKLFGSEYIGAGFAPFSVLKSNFAIDEFWDMEDLDVVSAIKNLNIAFTELRYLIRYGAFGLKWVKDLDIDAKSIHDLRGIISVSTQSKTGDQDTSALGEFQNRGDIQAVVNGIVAIMKVLYNTYGISLDSLVSVNARSSAESKIVDSKKLYQLIRDSQEIWQLNEDIIFKNMCSVWNRENQQQKIPAGVKMMVDFADSPLETIDKAEENENMQVLIANNIKTLIDWARQENPDLSESEAKVLIKMNKQENLGNKESDLEEGAEKKKALDDEEEKKKIQKN